MSLSPPLSLLFLSFLSCLQFLQVEPQCHSKNSDTLRSHSNKDKTLIINGCQQQILFCILLHGDPYILPTLRSPSFLLSSQCLNSWISKLFAILMFPNCITSYILIFNFQVVDYNCCYIIYHLQKQFRQPNSKQPPAQNKEASSQNIVHTSIDDTATNVSDGSQLTPPVQDQLEQPNAEGNRVSVHNRMRVPVTYDDLLVENPKDD